MADDEIWEVRMKWSGVSGPPLLVQSFNESVLPSWVAEQPFNGRLGSAEIADVAMDVFERTGIDLMVRDQYSDQELSFWADDQTGQEEGSLRDVLEFWCSFATEPWSQLTARQLAVQARRAPVPVYGSPPRGWVPLYTAIGLNGANVVIGQIAGEMVLVILGVAFTGIVWFLSPTAEVARQAVAEEVAHRIEESKRRRRKD